MRNIHFRLRRYLVRTLVSSNHVLLLYPVCLIHTDGGKEWWSRYDRQFYGYLFLKVTWELRALKPLWVSLMFHRHNVDFNFFYLQEFSRSCQEL